VVEIFVTPFEHLGDALKNDVISRAALMRHFALIDVPSLP